MLLVADGFSLFGLDIKFYGLIIAIGMLIAIFVVCKLCKNRGLKNDDIFLVALYALPLAIIGARLYFVLFSGHQFASFWEILDIRSGGMAILGGVIGGALGVLLFCLIHKKNFLCVADVAVVGLILGQGIGRIGCYFSSCCYGIEVTNPAAQWFPLATQIHGVWHYSTFFYESFFDLITFVGLIFAIRKLSKPGSTMALYLMCYGVIRVIIETFRGDSLYLFGTGIKVSQLLSGLMIVAGIILMICIYTIKRKGVKNENNNKAG